MVVVRDDRIVATMDLSTFDGRTFVVFLAVCDGVTIGQPGQPTIATPATPFEVKGFGRCDPYQVTCEQVYVSAEWLNHRAVVGITRQQLIPLPWMDCNDEDREGCPEDPRLVVVDLQLAPDDAVMFVSRFGCGSSPETACVELR
jgi:hypothetical protein